MHISFSAEQLFGSTVTNSILTGILASVVILLLVFWLTRSIKMKPGKNQNFAEWLFSGVLSLTEGITGGNRKEALLILPLGATFFLFIIVNNWLGLVPGVGSIGYNEIVDGHEVFVPIFRAANADLNTTLALALISVGATQYYGLRKLKLGYLKKYINVSSPINFFAGILEIVSELAKIISFSFRLFGNVFAGEVLLVVIISLVPYIAPIPFYGLEIFVGFVQALVFAMLSLVFFHVAMEAHH